MKVDEGRPATCEMAPLSPLKVVQLPWNPIMQLMIAVSLVRGEPGEPRLGAS